MMFPKNATMKQPYPKSIIDLEEPSKSDQVEAMVESSGLPDGPSRGTIEVVCAVAASQASPIFIEPYTFLETLREEKMAKYRAKRDPRWEGLIVSPERARQAMAFRKM